ncbi:PAS domain S-box protein [Magnetococcus sp. PR-3]|uniref:PAS domain S-box protein n=1 Tax=Magnetococcus sp. PR-3 TaxID=3120355 RepID=UPI002FCDEB40
MSGNAPFTHGYDHRMVQRTFLSAFVLWTLVFGASLYWDTHGEMRSVDELMQLKVESDYRTANTLLQWVRNHGMEHQNQGDSGRTQHRRQAERLNQAFQMLSVPQAGANPDLKNHTLHIRMISNEPLNSQNHPDGWELQALSDLFGGKKEIQGTGIYQGKLHYRLYRPITMKPHCQQCHAYTQQSVAALGVNVGLAPYQEAKAQALKVQMTSHGGVWLLGSVLLLIGYRRWQQHVQLHQQQHRRLERFRKQLDQAHDSIFVVDYHTSRIMDANQTACDRLGYDLAELRQKCLYELETRLSNLSAWQRLMRRFAQQKNLLFKTRVLCRDGRSFPVEINAHLHQDGRRRFLIGAARDISERYQAELALSQREQMFRSLVELSRAIFWRYDLKKGCFTYISPESESILGYPADSWSGLQCWAERIHPDDRAWATNYCQVSTEKGEDHSFNYRCITQSGEVKWIHDVVTVVKDEQEEPTELLGIMFDMTQRELQAQQNQQILQDRAVISALLEAAVASMSLKEMLERALDVVLTQSRITTLNRGAIFLTDPHKQELVLQVHRDMELLTDTCNRVICGTCACGMALQKKQIVFVRSDEDLHSVSYDGMQPHGHYCTPIMDGENCLGVLNIYLEHEHPRSADEEEFLEAVANTMAGIIKRSRAEEALQEKSTYIDNILQHSTEIAIAATDLEYRITYFNPVAEQVFGKQADEVIGRTVMEIHLEQHIPAYRFDQAIAAVKKDGEHRYVTEQQHSSGTRTIASRLAGINNGQGETIGYVLMAQDVTEQKALEQSLFTAKQRADAANQAKSTFLATMSHEIRTPMNTILGMGELLQKTALNETQAGYLEVLNRSGEGLLTLINDILDISKIEAHKLTLEETVFDLSLLVSNTVQMFNYAARKKEIGLQLQYTGAIPPWVSGDPTRLRQVLLNLIGNAVKFTQSGHVTIEVEHQSEVDIHFKVKDTGPGIAAERQKAIFEPFTQSAPHTARQHGGTGLGLTICLKLVEMMGGKLTLETQEGQGSCFAFVLNLPSAPAPEPCQTHQEMVSVSLDDQPALTILVVDDAQDNRLLIQAFMDDQPHRLLMAEDGLQGVEKYKDAAPDLILMDIQMPRLDGIEATHQIRQWELDKGVDPTVIIALTADTMGDTAQRVMQAGCNHYMSKPIRKRDLLATIQRYSQDQVNRPTEG